MNRIHPPRWLHSLTIATGFVAALLSGCSSKNESASLPEIEVLCAVSQRIPLEEAAKAYEAEGLGKIKMQFGGSQAMLSILKVSDKADIFLPADISYVEMTAKEGLTAETVPLAGMTAVIGVAKGNPKGIRTLADLQKPEVRLVLANPKIAAISKLASESLPPDTWKTLESRVLSMKANVNDAANDIVLGAADAAIIWDVTARQTAGVEAVTVSEISAIHGLAAGAVSAKSGNPAEALKFLRWLASPEKGARIFAKNGYSAVPGSAGILSPP